MARKSAQQGKHAGGRPLSYTEDVGSEICTKLADGWSLVEICKPAHMPGRSTVHLWLLQGELHRDHQEEGKPVHPLAQFLDNYVRAREIQADTLIDDILEIADNSMNDWVERENQRTGATWVELDKEAVPRAKLRVEARFRLAERLFPKKYGQKVDHTLKGDKENPIPIKQAFSGVPDDHRGWDHCVLPGLAIFQLNEQLSVRD